MKTSDPTVRADSGERDEPHVLVIAGDRSIRRTLDRTGAPSSSAAARTVTCAE
jgi:hypothetical protein